MNWHLYIKEVKSSIISTLIWTTIMSLLIVKLVSNFYSDSAVVGAYGNLVVTFFMWLFGGIFSMILTSTLISKEEFLKTSEHTNTLPISRSGIFISKLASYLTNMLIFTLTVFAVHFMSLKVFQTSGVDVKTFIYMCINTVVILILYGSIVLVVSLFITNNVILIIGSVCYGFFANMIRYSDKIWGYISISKFIDLERLQVTGKLDTLAVLIMSVASIMMFVLAYMIYKQKDLK